MNKIIYTIITGLIIDSCCIGQDINYQNYNPQQTDFSKEYFELQTKRYSSDSNQLQQSLKYDFSPIWIYGNEAEQNGVLGLTYQRIQFHINFSVWSEHDPDTYFIAGKSKVKNNVCNFTGKITLLKVYIYDTIVYPKHFSYHKTSGELFAKYTIYEDSSQNNTGIFKGITECSFYLDSTGKYMRVDESEGGDGYWNRTFVGTWTDYKTKEELKCIWGDYRLPFVFDFAAGDGMMIAPPKYQMNGWQSFNDGTEFIEVSKNKWELRDKWWLSK